jgi:hypothetical protein
LQALADGDAQILEKSKLTRKKKLIEALHEIVTDDVFY